MPHVRKPKLIDERFERYARYLVSDPRSMRGKWMDLMPGARSLHVDLGCGKGVWAARVALAHPDCLIVGIDYERMCVSFAMERAAGAGVGNALFVFDSAHSVEDLFAPGEIDVLHVNFPTPFPRKKQARSRVTDGNRLMAYREVLGTSGQLHLKTDSQPLFDFTLEELMLAGYEVLWATRDMRGEAPAGAQGASSVAVSADGKGATAFDLAMSAYEERLVAEGACVHALHAKAGREPAHWAPRDPVSLVDYLPDDLESLTYVPHGMQGTVENILNQRKNARLRGER